MPPLANTKQANRTRAVEKKARLGANRRRPGHLHHKSPPGPMTYWGVNDQKNHTSFYLIS
eukprot:6829912-Pyramimonas_sp.AAC.1